MGLKRSKPLGRADDQLRRLWRFFERHLSEWKTANAGFERRNVVIADGAQWTVIYKIHGVRSERARAAKLELKSSITVWPARATGKGKPSRPGRGAVAGRPPDLWLERYGRVVRQHGYRGRWQESPVGRFGDFWKPLRDARAVAAEVKRLDRLRL
jgi:hypothetical protein